MSIRTKALAACRKCGHQHEVEVYKSINTGQDPDLKAGVISGELFLWECPECGQSNLLTYECLYHDPDAKIMIWMLPFGEPDGPQKEAIMNQARAMGDYRLRTVQNVGELMEKVIIFEAGLDDRCIALVKYVAGQELKDVESLHFYRMQDDVMVFSGVKGGKMEGFGFGINVYEDCMGILGRNPDLSGEKGFCRVDSSWVDSIMR